MVFNVGGNLSVHTRRVISSIRPDGDTFFIILEVRIRLNDCIDLVSAEAIYHKACHRKFMLNTKRSIENIKSPGRPESHDKSDIFIRLCNWVELYTVTELHTKVLEISAGNENIETKTPEVLWRFFLL